jgi:hypothetical protein
MTSSKQLPHKSANKAIKDPQKIYGTPQAVVADQNLTQKEKARILESWEQDQIALMRADQENITPQNAVQSPASVLEKIKKAENALKKDSESRA